MPSASAFLVATDPRFACDSRVRFTRGFGGLRFRKAIWTKRFTLAIRQAGGAFFGGRSRRNCKNEHFLQEALGKMASHGFGLRFLEEALGKTAVLGGTVFGGSPGENGDLPGWLAMVLEEALGKTAVPGEALNCFWRKPWAKWRFARLDLHFLEEALGKMGHSMVGGGAPLPIVLEEALGQMAIPGLDRPGPRPLFWRKPWAKWPFPGWAGQGPGHCFRGSPGPNGRSRVEPGHALDFFWRKPWAKWRFPWLDLLFLEEALGRMAIPWLDRARPCPLFWRKPWATWPCQGWTRPCPWGCLGGSPGQNGHARVGQARAPPIVLEEALGEMAIPGWHQARPSGFSGRKPRAKWPFQGWAGQGPAHCFRGSPGQYGPSRVGQARAPAHCF
jgi:hypothetical protein